jgi:hypothetical protein
VKVTIVIGLIFLAGILLSASDWLVEKIETVEPNRPLLSCANPTVINANSCNEREEQILNTTVRILIETWLVADNEQGYIIDHSAGHATVTNGRYLVTHNHFSIALSIRQQADAGHDNGASYSGANYSGADYSVIFLYDTQGNLLHKSSLSDFEIIREEQETLILAHKQADFFDELGIESAEFKDWRSLPLEIGMEVAQVDWDGRTTRVDWATVQDIRLHNETPVLIIDDGARPGASGGGIFWNGYYVANNWHIEEKIDGVGDVIETITVGALNTDQIAQ